MIDLHTHILPGLDDGASSWQDSLEMAEQAWESGVHTLVATSHANLPGQSHPQEKEACLKQLQAFREKLEAERLELDVLSGMEIYMDEYALRRLENGELLCIHDTSYVLVEFAMNGPASDIYVGLDALLKKGYRPILAHPERYRCVQRVPAHVREWRDMGCVIQMNKGSILGAFGQNIARTADELLRHELVDVVASDAHSPRHRTTRMDEVVQVLRRHYGNRYTQYLLEINPANILNNR